MEEGLEKKTGKPLSHWTTVVQASKLTKHGEIVKMLKAEHDFTHGFANFVALKALASDAASVDDNELIEAQYGKKPGLRPIYELLEKKIRALGKDVEVAPKKANVSFRVKRQFALIQPSTKSRIDLGLKFDDRAVGGRLEASGPFGSMCTHRVQITDISQVDKDLLGLIRDAYREAK